MSRTVRTLLQNAPVLDPVITGSEVYDLFSEDSDLLVCAVVEAGKPIGLVARNAFFLRMADTHGRALFAKRPVTYVMDKDPLVVDSNHLLSQLSRHIVTDRISALFDGFIITENGRYAGVGTGVGEQSGERGRPGGLDAAGGRRDLAARPVGAGGRALLARRTSLGGLRDRRLDVCRLPARSE